MLVGLSGSGKSTVGRLLAAWLEVPLVDTDELVVQSAGASIPEIFRQQGEAAFRSLEARAVERAVAGPPSVLATGGGAPVSDANRRRLWRGNFVVWLDAPVPTLAARVGDSGSGRPLLAGDGARDGATERLAALRAAREKVYATAHARIDTERLDPEEVARQIVALLEQHP